VKKVSIWLGVTMLLLGMLSGVALAADEMAPLPVLKSGDMLTDNLKVQTMDGKTIELKSALEEGKYTVFQFMTTACGACQAELVNLARLQKELGADKYTIKSIAMDLLGADAVKAYEARNKFGITYLLDPEFKLPPRFGFNYTPSLFIADASGKIVFSQGGYADAAWDMIKGKMIKAMP